MKIPRFVKFVPHEISRVEETMADEINIWEATPSDNAFLYFSNVKTNSIRLTDGSARIMFPMYPEIQLILLIHTLKICIMSAE